MFEVKKELLDSHEALLDVTIEEPTVQKAMRSAARHIARQVNIPGFRKGKAPYSVVVRNVGEGAVMQEAADDLLEELYPKFIEGAEITPYASGSLENMEINPLVFKIRVPLQPSVVLGEYSAIRKSWEEPSVNDNEIDMVLDQMRDENAMVEPVDRPAEMGDEAQINVRGTVNNEVVVDEEDIKVVFSVNRPFLSNEFQEALIGISKDEERTFTVPLPNEMESEELRGAETEFTVKATQVSERTLPGLDDAFASTVGAFETLEAVKQDINDRILQSKQQQTQTAYRNELVEMLVEPAEVHYPPLMVSEMLDEMVEETGTRMQRERQMSLEDTLRLEGRTLEQFREELNPQAENRVKTSLVLAEFARVEETTVTDDDVVQEYQGFFSNLNLGPDMEMPSISLDSELARNIRSNLLGSKALQRLEQIARGLADDDAEASEAEDTDAEDADVDDGAAEESEDLELNSAEDDDSEDNVVEDNVVEDSVADDIDAGDSVEESDAEDDGDADTSIEEDNSIESET